MFDKGIEAFIAIATTQSISAAAERLYITQPAVTHRLKELEAHLGMVLLDRQRGSRTTQLTQAGEMFYPIAEKWQELGQEIKQIHSTISRISVRIGCVDSISTFLLPEFYRELARSQKSIHIRIHTMRSSQLYERISNRELDVAFALRKIHMKNVHIKTFYEESMFVVQSATGEDFTPEIDLHDLDPEKELFLNWSPPYQTWHDHQWKGLLHSKIELDSFSLALKLIKGTNNWVILPESIINSIKKDSAFKVQKPVQEIPKRMTYIVTHQYPRIGGKEGRQIVLDLAEQFARNKFHFNAGG